MARRHWANKCHRPCPKDREKYSKFDILSGYPITLNLTRNYLLTPRWHCRTRCVGCIRDGYNRTLSSWSRCWRWSHYRFQLASLRETNERSVCHIATIFKPHVETARVSDASRLYFYIKWERCIYRTYIISFVLFLYCLCFIEFLNF